MERQKISIPEVQLFLPGLEPTASEIGGLETALYLLEMDARKLIDAGQDPYRVLRIVMQNASNFCLEAGHFGGHRCRSPICPAFQQEILAQVRQQAVQHPQRVQPSLEQKPESTALGGYL